MFEIYGTYKIWVLFNEAQESGDEWLGFKDAYSSIAI
jgi:hypothetical protein